MRKKRLDSDHVSTSQSRDVCGSTTLGSSYASIQDRPPPKRPTSRSIINCESLPKGIGLPQVLDTIESGKPIPRQFAPGLPSDQDFDASSDEDDSFLQELVDILDAKKPDGLRYTTALQPGLKMKSAAPSPRQHDTLYLAHFHSPETDFPKSQEPVKPMRLDQQPGKRQLVRKRSKTIKINLGKSRTSRILVAPSLGIKIKDGVGKRSEAEGVFKDFCNDYYQLSYVGLEESINSH